MLRLAAMEENHTIGRNQKFNFEQFKFGMLLRTKYIAVKYISLDFRREISQGDIKIEVIRV